MIASVDESISVAPRLRSLVFRFCQIVLRMLVNTETSKLLTTDAYNYEILPFSDSFLWFRLWPYFLRKHPGLIKYSI